MLSRYFLNMAVAFAGVLLVLNLARSIIALSKKGELVKQAEEKLAQERLENDELKRELSEVQSPDYIEKEAREKLNLGKEGEIVIILPSIPPEPGEKLIEELPNWKKWLNLYW